MDGSCSRTLALVLLVIDVMEPCLRGRFHSGRLRYHSRHVHRFTSNICAISRLRSLYFLLANLDERGLSISGVGLSIILIFVGIKNDPVQALSDPELHLARGHYRGAGRHHWLYPFL